MTTITLATALTDCAVGLCPLGAGVAPLTAEGTFLHRDDFTSRFIEHGTSGGIPMAAIDRDAAITALNAGGRRILAAAASFAAGIPAGLRDTSAGLDANNVQRLIAAISHASGQRPGGPESEEQIMTPAGGTGGGVLQ